MSDSTYSGLKPERQPKDHNKPRLSDQLATIANELIDAVRVSPPDDTVAEPSTSYRRLLKKAMALAAGAKRELDKRDSEIAKLKLLSITDEVTRLLNRRGFDYALDRALGRSRRFDESGLVMLIDLDGFKQINDTFGHQAGDLVLASVATLLRVNTRDIDDVARIGGDEFSIILAGVDELLGQQKAAQIETMLNNLSVPWNGLAIQVRASVGVAHYDQTDTPQDIVRRADERMYSQKRNRPSRLTLVAGTDVAPQKATVTYLPAH